MTIGLHSGRLSPMDCRKAAVSLSVLGCIVIAVSAGFVPGSIPPWAIASFWRLAMAALGWMRATELDNAVELTPGPQGRFGFAERTESAARITQLALSFVLVDGASSALMSKWVSLCVMVVNSPHQNGCFGLDEFLGGSIRFVATEVAS